MNDQKKPSKVEFSLETIRNNSVTRKQLEGFVDEVVLCMQKIKSEQEAIKDIRTEAKEQLGIPGKVLGRLVRERMQAGSIEAEIAELEEAQALADVIEGSSNQP